MGNQSQSFGRVKDVMYLIKSFGQSKGIRFYDQQDRMKVDSTQVEDKVMKAAGVVAEEQIQAAPKVQEVEIIPKRDEAATRSDQASWVKARYPSR